MNKTTGRIIILCFYFSFLTLAVAGQNPLSPLRVYQYDTDNNHVDIEKEVKNDFGNIYFANVFFRYYKNPLYNQTFNPVKLMLFRLKYEFMLQIRIEDKNETVFNFPFLENEDRLTKVNLICITEKDGKSYSKKVSNKYYDTVVNDSVISIKLKEEAISINTILRIFCSIESPDMNLKNLASMNDIPNSKNFISLNVPVIFKYITGNQYLDLVTSKSNEMTLIAFSYDVDKLTERYNVKTSTYIWKVRDQLKNHSISFPLLSISLPIDSFLGTDANELINKGK